MTAADQVRDIWTITAGSDDLPDDVIRTLAALLLESDLVGTDQGSPDV